MTFFHLCPKPLTDRPHWTTWTISHADRSLVWKCYRRRAFSFIECVQRIVRLTTLQYSGQKFQIFDLADCRFISLFLMHRKLFRSPLLIWHDISAFLAGVKTVIWIVAFHHDPPSSCRIDKNSYAMSHGKKMEIAKLFNLDILPRRKRRVQQLKQMANLQTGNTWMTLQEKAIQVLDSGRKSSQRLGGAVFRRRWA